MSALNFDATTVAPQESPSPIPAGVYLAQVIESDERPLKSGAGRAVALTFQVLQGPYANRKVWSQINYRHTNADAERIGQSQLSALCHAVGVVRMQDTTQLHMRPVMIRVKIRKDDSGQYGDRNDVSGYEAVASGGGGINVPGAMPAATQQLQAAPAAPAGYQSAQPPFAAVTGASAGAPPWARRA